MTHLHIPANRPLTEINPNDRRAAPTSQRVGVLISQDVEGGPEQHVELIQCCHCQRIWPFVRGSGNVRGWCGQCGKLTCGSNECDVCVPARQLLDNMAAGMPFHVARTHRPITARVEAAPPRKSPGGVILGKK